MPCNGALQLLEGPGRVEVCPDGVFIFEKPAGTTDDLLLLLNEPSRDFSCNFTLFLRCRWALRRDDRFVLKARQLAQTSLRFLRLRNVLLYLALDASREAR